ncbi:cell wall / vacuolar inhibitor of fructosidase 1-like [Spinacia oleracea]|uniref:Cell wall / vacuolar inhibitor of fructosidase 1-like n=1 Tax=Spinacia oleracea TaxID=3562 RepID=A0ABM3RNI4_SPIOL|nr:cell wall / vacuolar inhibitor of fructosidase 1-like [Spinacia oleracea]
METISKALILLSIVAHLIILGHAQNTTLITQTCNQTPNYNLCVSTLTSDPKTRYANDTRHLAIIMVLHANGLSTKTQNHIFGLIRNRGIAGPVRQLLDKCYQNYSRIITNRLIETVEDLLAKRYAFAPDMMKNVQRYVNVCEGSFKKPVKSPISADNKAMFDLSGVAYAIISHLSNNNVT